MTKNQRAATAAVDKKLYAEVSQKCKETGVSISWLINQAFRLFVNGYFDVVPDRVTEVVTVTRDVKRLQPAKHIEAE